MKAVIVELRDGYASVLSDDGCVVKIKNNNYELGQVIYINNTGKSMVRKIAMFAASAAAVLVLGTGTWAYASPYSYVSLDVNPSIEYVLNRFDRVININAVNEDGEEILHEFKLGNIKHKTIKHAIHQTLDQITDLGYLNSDTKSGIIIATSGKNLNKADQLAHEIKEEVEQDIVDSYDDLPIDATVEAYSVGMERVEKAKELGVTPGKLNLVEKMISSSDDAENIKLEEWLDKPVSDIISATAKGPKAHNVIGSENKKAEKEIAKAEKEAAKKKEKADKEAVKEKEKADKEAVKEKEKADREAIKEIDKANKEASKADKEANKNKAKADKEVAKEKVKTDKKANKEKQKTDKEAAKDEKQANKNTDKADKEVAKEKVKTDKEANKEKQKADKEASKADKEANKNKAKGDKETSKEKGKADKEVNKTKNKTNKEALKNKQQHSRKFEYR